MIEVINGRVFIDGKETINPELIGYAILDGAENEDLIVCNNKTLDELMIKCFESGMKAGEIVATISDRIKV